MAERLALYEQLAEAGDDDAFVWLGERYRDGDGVARDVTHARALFERAAALASVDGLRELGRMYEDGIGGPADELRARACYEQAAELGADAFSRDVPMGCRPPPRMETPKGTSVVSLVPSPASAVSFGPCFTGPAGSAPALRGPSLPFPTDRPASRFGLTWYARAADE